LIWFFIIRRPVKFKCLTCWYEIETTKSDDAFCNDCNLAMKKVTDIK
jgi:DNA-directed RNA polymerase subunit RPC12/RpoP